MIAGWAKGRAPVGQWETERDDYLERVRAAGDEGFERGRQRGRLVSLEAAIDDTLG